MGWIPASSIEMRLLPPCHTLSDHLHHILIYHKHTCIWVYYTLCQPLSGQRRRFIKKPQNFSGFWSHRTPSFSPSRISQSWCRVFRDLRDFLLEVVDLCVLFCLSGAELLLLSTWELVIDTSSDPSYKQTNTVSTITETGPVLMWFLNNIIMGSYNQGNIKNFFYILDEKKNTLKQYSKTSPNLWLPIHFCFPVHIFHCQIITRKFYK